MRFSRRLEENTLILSIEKGTLANNPRDSFSSLTTVYSQLLGAGKQPYTRFVARGRQCDDDLFRSRMNGGVETK